ncbi:MAG: ChbG/HpnK family deacetylase, partial [Proteobacteria bacterium]|nr:ChbG/HpnK family deacetylase [Pseudomonadota bacterium]
MAVPSSASSRPIVVCADDYGLAAGVSDAIAELIAAGRLSATSCMTTMADWRRAAAPLRELVRRAPADVGLHLTLTDQAPLSRASGLAIDGRLPPLGRLLPRALAPALPAAALVGELRAPLGAFEDAWGSPPDYVAGHQHVHV